MTPPTLAKRRFDQWRNCHLDILINRWTRPSNDSLARVCWCCSKRTCSSTCRNHVCAAVLRYFTLAEHGSAFILRRDTLGTLQAVQQFVGMPCYDFSSIAQYWTEGGIPQRPTTTWSEWVSVVFVCSSRFAARSSFKWCVCCVPNSGSYG